MTFAHVHDACVDIPVFDSRSLSIKNTIGKAITGGRIIADRGVVSVRALDGINLRLETGDRVALIGHNGAGKSTLLRLLAGIYRPDVGFVNVEGRVGALLSMHLGMEPDFTGRENLMLVAASLGLSEKERNAIVPEVAEFCELGDFIDLPIQTYSAGMLARLAFGIHTSIAHDIMLIDEVIGAGDMGFHDKMRARLEQMLARARILVLASHAEDVLRLYCTTGVVMSAGRMIFSGPLDDAFDFYHSSIGLCPASDR
ncbi:ABC transporter ATP-binding protein [Neoaquamicrobium sediminum]|uniref:ABC transporter ATP-binding protein n=1 Tax=Neoaquamicrobium sediminum TaxID=1849104 RepID=UPI001563E28A|nr:ATP-binding cassette domain-containing protein [Mesorhizobium sediminum]NRC56201.1 ABC transporter ATP-binding protein [Mesorhizobium sediminum]